MEIKQVKDFWEKCDISFAHLTADRHLGGYDKLTKFWETRFLNDLSKIIDLSTSVVIDYGTGAGYLGMYLNEKHNIKKYIGIDIAERSIAEAEKNLQKTDADYILLLAPVIFSDLEPDVFISQAVIQHFPTEEYLVDFLENVNMSGSKVVMLQIAEATAITKNKTAQIKNNDYLHTNDVVRRCTTYPAFVSEKLTNYTLKSKNPGPRDYVFLTYEKNL